MGTIDRLQGKSVYIDANVIIYIVEGFPTLRAVLRDITQALDDGLFTAATSELTLAEVLVLPLRTANRVYEVTYTTMLSGQEKIEVLPVTRAVLVEAARIRAERGQRLPDAIHVATATLHGCNTFLTNDHRLRTPAGLTVVTLAELAQS